MPWEIGDEVRSNVSGKAKPTSLLDEDFVSSQISFPLGVIWSATNVNAELRVCESDIKRIVLLLDINYKSYYQGSWTFLWDFRLGITFIWECLCDGNDWGHSFGKWLLYAKYFIRYTLKKKKYLVGYYWFFRKNWTYFRVEEFRISCVRGNIE